MAFNDELVLAKLFNLHQAEREFDQVIHNDGVSTRDGRRLRNAVEEAQDEFSEALTKHWANQSD